MFQNSVFLRGQTPVRFQKCCFVEAKRLNRKEVPGGSLGGPLGVPWGSLGSLGLLGRFRGSLGSPLRIFQNSVFRRGGSA